MKYKNDTSDSDKGVQIIVRQTTASLPKTERHSRDVDWHSRGPEDRSCLSL